MVRLIAIPAILLPCWFAAASTSAADDAGDVVFVRHIAPLLREKCLACHGGNPENIEGHLDLRTLQGVLVGGDSGLPSLVPGKPSESPLYLAVTREHDVWSGMPPKEAERLTPQQLVRIHDWIAGGASWPAPERIAEISRANAEAWSAEDGITVKTSGGQSPGWTDRGYQPEGLWAYQPIRKPAIPETSENAIDALIAARMPQGLSVAVRADAATFVRRATFDLTGLPPTPDEVQTFVEEFQRTNGASLTYEKLIDRLLESPHYGERMAQHWLDVVRYADSSGFANDYVRGNAWRYRDYVIRSFNSDKPYDQFVREQIAGDEIDPDNPEMLIATGFLRMGPWELTGMEVAKIARQRFLDDVTNSVGETFLAHSLQCARCHDHKFDPIPARDYYAVQAVFATTQLAERPAAFLPVENTIGFEERRFLEQARTDHLEMLDRLDEKSLLVAEAWLADKQIDPGSWHDALGLVEKRLRGSAFAAARNRMLKQGIPEDQIPPRMLGWTPEEIGLERISRKGLERLTWELDRYEPFALAVYSGRTPQRTSVVAPLRIPADRLTQGELEESCVLIGGDPFAPGEKVLPGILSVLNHVQADSIPQSPEGRRKAFAEWVSNADNPLTSRAIVNRIWLWHFGKPLAGNPNNFGSTGKRPTHPELLDWLAARFSESGWSFKAMHRMIMNSDAYRRSTQHADPEALMELDPLRSSYAAFQPRRLTAEELRDAMLLVTGELNPMLGGIPNRPEINLEAALQPRQVMGTFAAAWTPNPLPQQRHRRSIYAQKLRGLTDPFMDVFNVPSSDFSCEQREASTVTPQIFSLFNGQAVHARALALANRVLTERQETDVANGTGHLSRDEQAIERCFELVLLRRPNGDERQTCLAHWYELEATLSEAARTPRRPPLEIRRDAVEENTGERFSFSEMLYANAEFVPDLQPSQVDRHTRALADVCLVLLNCSEFVYVY